MIKAIHALAMVAPVVIFCTKWDLSLDIYTFHKSFEQFSL